MEDIKPPEQSSETVPNQTPPAGQSPLGGAPPTPEQPKKNWVRITVLITVIITILLFIPLPYYQTQEVLCKLSVGHNCPQKGFHLGDPLWKVLLFSFRLPKNQETIQPQPKPTPTPTPDPTANWKTYRNDKFGFMFEQQSNDKIEEREQPEYINIFQLEAIDYEQYYTKDNIPISGLSYLHLAINKNNEPCLLTKSSDLKNGKTTIMNIGGQQAELVEGESGYGMYRRSVCLKHNNYTYWLLNEISATSNFPEAYLTKNKKLFDHVLSTFKFTQ